MADKKKYTNCDQVYKQLQKYLAGIDLESGERVPSERQIADDLGVNRTTLRSAMQRMVDEGLMNRQIGVGTFFKVCPKSMKDYAKISTKCSNAELTQTRLILEPQIAHIAAINISTAELLELKALFDNCNKENLHEMEKTDIDFNYRLAVISKNSMLADIYSVVCRSRKKLLENCPDIEDKNGFISIEIWDKYQGKILTALEKNDSNAAHDTVISKLNSLFS